MPEPLRFGIIGCGVIGPTHADALASLPDAHLVAAADERADRARAFGERYAVTSYTSAQEMLERERLDVVCVCTPSGMHGVHARMAMRSGRHVIVEKPIEITREAIDQLLQAQRDAGVKLAVISQHRWDPASQQVDALVREGAFGRLTLGIAHVPWWRSQAYYDSGAWRGTWTLDGGGVLINQAIHSLDLLQWFMGRVTHVKAYTSTLAHTMETEDVATAVLRFESGALGSIIATTAAFPGVGTSIAVYGDRGSAVIGDDKLTFLQLARDIGEVGAYGVGTPKYLNTGTGPAGTAADPAALNASTHAQQIADMIRAIREGGDPLLDGNAARHPVDIILSIYESSRTGLEVRLP